VLRTEEVSVKVGAAGHAVLPLSDVRLVDAQNNAVAPGQRGEICVRGPQVMAGYWNNREATNEVIDADGWFHTGDIGQADEDGYVYVVDRLKDMVITGGENVYPAEVETVLYSHPAIAEVAVLGTPHQQWGEAVTAVVALNPGANSLATSSPGTRSRCGWSSSTRCPAIQLARSSSTSSLHSSPPRHKAKLTCTPLTAAGVAPIPVARLVVTGAGCAERSPSRR
jgi:acyl-CoA synthetase (AMP-forming)/AMP-acid ligase II